MLDQKLYAVPQSNERRGSSIPAVAVCRFRMLMTTYMHASRSLVKREQFYLHLQTKSIRPKDMQTNK